jgi:hypothetical protein
MDNNSTFSQLLASCKYTAEELENVGKCLHTCDDCKNYKYSDRHGIHYCLEKSEFDDDDESEIVEYYEVHPFDNILDDHGDKKYRSGEIDPCEYFELKDSFGQEPFYSNMYEWLNEQLDIEYIISSNGEYKGGVVVTGTGGPHIEIDTVHSRVNGYWWGTEASYPVDSHATNALDEVLEEMYEATRC